MDPNSKLFQNVSRNSVTAPATSNPLTSHFTNGQHEDNDRPIRGQYPGHVTSGDQSEACSYVNRMGCTVGGGVLSGLFSNSSSSSSSLVTNSIPDEFRNPPTQNFGDYLKNKASSQTLKRKRSGDEQEADQLVEDLLAGSDSDDDIDVKPIIIEDKRTVLTNQRPVSVVTNQRPVSVVTNQRLNIRTDLFTQDATNITNQSNVTVKTPQKDDAKNQQNILRKDAFNVNKVINVRNNLHQQQQNGTLSPVVADNDNIRIILSRASIENNALKNRGQNSEQNFKNIHSIPGSTTLTKVPQTGERDVSRNNIKERTILPKGQVPSQSSSIPPNVTFLNSPWMPWNQAATKTSIIPPNVTASNSLLTHQRSVLRSRDQLGPIRGQSRNPTVVKRVFDQHFYSPPQSISPIIQNYQSLAPQSEKMAVSNRMGNNQNQFLSSGDQMFPSSEHSYANNVMTNQKPVLTNERPTEHSYANNMTNESPAELSYANIMTNQRPVFQSQDPVLTNEKLSEHSYANTMFPSAEHAYANTVMMSPLYQPIRGQYPGHVTSVSQSEARPRYLSSRRTDGVPLFDDPTLPPGWTR